MKQKRPASHKNCNLFRRLKASCAKWYLVLRNHHLKNKLNNTFHAVGRRKT